MYQAIHNFPRRSKVQFQPQGDIFEILEYIKPTPEDKGFRTVEVVLKNLSKDEALSYCHPTYPAKGV